MESKNKPMPQKTKERKVFARDVLSCTHSGKTLKVAITTFENGDTYVHCEENCLPCCFGELVGNW